MADFSPAINKAIRNIVPGCTVLNCRFHFWQLIVGKMRSKTFFPKKVLAPQDIPARFKSYFNLQSVRNRAKKFDISKVIRYDICILSKLPTKKLFDNYIRIITPFWKMFAAKFLSFFKENYVNDEAKNGWMDFKSVNQPKTNNHIEGYNKALKSIVVSRGLTSFNEYFDLLVQELENKSIEASRLAKFPTSSSFRNEFYLLAKVLANNFNTVFTEYENNYYISDPSANASFETKKRQLKTFFKTKLSKFISGEETHLLLSRVSVPSLNEITEYEKGDFKIKALFINAIKIRKVCLILPMNLSNPLSCISCTCPDFRQSSYCLHSLAVLIKHNYLNSEPFLANNRRGRSRIPLEWQNDGENEDQENEDLQQDI